MFVGCWFGESAIENLNLACVACSLAPTYAADTDTEPASTGQKRVIPLTVPSATQRLKINCASSRSLLSLGFSCQLALPMLQPSPQTSTHLSDSLYHIILIVVKYCLLYFFFQLGRYSVRAGFLEVAAGTDFSSCPPYHLWSDTHDHGN